MIHYTGNATDTAKANANYFRTINRGSSAHYFVDDTTVYQVVPDGDTAWAQGKNYGSNNLFGTVTNSNALSIEMCGTNGRVSDKTFENTLDLTRSLMSTYGIPANNVVRHYDVCSKRCPGWSGWLPGNEALWNSFKNQLGSGASNVSSEITGLSTNDTETAMKGEIEMKCFFGIKGKGTIWYYDGYEIRGLAHPDELNILNTIYKANNGKDIPCFTLETSATWYARLQNVLNRKPTTSL